MPLELTTLAILSISNPITLVQLYRRHKRKVALRKSASFAFARASLHLTPRRKFTCELNTQKTARTHTPEIARIIIEEIETTRVHFKPISSSAGQLVRRPKSPMAKVRDCCLMLLHTSHHLKFDLNFACHKTLRACCFLFWPVFWCATQTALFMVCKRLTLATDYKRLLRTEIVYTSTRARPGDGELGKQQRWRWRGRWRRRWRRRQRDLSFLACVDVCGRARDGDRDGKPRRGAACSTD